MSAVHVVVPDGIDDPARPSGGNAYDRRVCCGLAAAGWSVRVHPVAGSWPRADAPARAALAGVVDGLPDGAVVLLDGLVASTVPEVLVPHASRLRLVVLVHMPLGQDAAGDGARTREAAVLSAATMVVTTSEWTRRMLLAAYALPTDRVRVAAPGVDRAGLAPGTATGGSLLCVGAVTALKGQDVLLDALTTIRELSWRCVYIGSLDREPAFADALRRRVRDGPLRGRVQFPGPRTGADLDRAYEAADLLVLASRTEAYGMVVTEALARGLPVVAADVGGVREALGHATAGALPGLLVPPGEVAGLRAALRAWLEDAGLRQRLRRAARERRSLLTEWPATTGLLAEVLTKAAR